MEKEELIKFCRYYNGKPECPKGTKETFWNYERHWVNDTWEVMSDTKQEKEHLCFSFLTEYVGYGLSSFGQYDGVPVTLKALLFNRYSHWLRPDPQGFKEWYKSEYLGS